MRVMQQLENMKKVDMERSVRRFIKIKIVETGPVNGGGNGKYFS